MLNKGPETGGESADRGPEKKIDLKATREELDAWTKKVKAKKVERAKAELISSMEEANERQALLAEIGQQDEPLDPSMFEGVEEIDFMTGLEQDEEIFMKKLAKKEADEAAWDAEPTFVKGPDGKMVTKEGLALADLEASEERKPTQRERELARAKKQKERFAARDERKNDRAVAKANKVREKMLDQDADAAADEMMAMLDQDQPNGVQRDRQRNKEIRREDREARQDRRAVAKADREARKMATDSAIADSAAEMEELVGGTNLQTPQEQDLDSFLEEYGRTALNNPDEGDGLADNNQ